MERHIPDSAYEPFDRVISGLNVALIATDVDQLETCRFEERVRDVQDRSSGFADDYDHLPVKSNGTFCGFLAVKRADDDGTRVRDSRGFLPLSSDLLIGADTPILSVLDPPSGMPWEGPRLVVSGSGIVGLVTAEDLLKPPSELVLGALMLEVERRMIRQVERTDGRRKRWMDLCSDDEHKNWEKASRALSLIYYTRFPTKLKILKETKALDLTNRQCGRLIGLRNALFHARFPSEYDPAKIQRAIKSIRVALAKLGGLGERSSPQASEMRAPKTGHSICSRHSGSSGVAIETSGRGVAPAPRSAEVAPSAPLPDRARFRWPLWGGGVAVAAVVAALLLWPRAGEVSGPSAVDGQMAEESLALSLADRVLIQRGLTEAGYDPGESDGLLGSGTRAALRLWQGSRGVEVTGYLETETAEVLRSAGEVAVREDSAATAREVASRAAAAQAREDSLARVRTASAAAERRRPGREFRDCAACPVMVVVPTGSYRMGSPGGEAERWDDEGPVHTVRIGYAVAVGKYEVTFDEWDACVSGGGCRGHRPEDYGMGRGSRPVINVSWEDAREYTRWLSRETGEAYRLPSEAEWEYVARGGTTTARHWGESESGQCGYANGRDATYQQANPDSEIRTFSCADGYENTAPVGTFGANGFGLHDVLGNVREWTEDCWHDSYSGAPSDGGAWTAGGDCSQRVVRGGSWYSVPWYLRSADRDWSRPRLRYHNVGFRVARTIN